MGELRWRYGTTIPAGAGKVVAMTTWNGEVVVATENGVFILREDDKGMALYPIVFAHADNEEVNHG
jgi:hypothetical protein